MEVKYEEVGSLKPGRYIMMEGRPCEIVGMDWSAPGKHGHAKYRITAIDLLTGTKKMAVYTSHDKVEVPIIEKKNAQVLNIIENKAQIMDLETYETFEAEIAEELKGQIQPNYTVVYWDLMGNKIIKQIKTKE
ncbi:MAG: translation initiation factor IF-5A [Candidatus Nanoarchaeia archaeon]